MPAYGYLRLSSMRKDGHEVSPETQEREVRDLAARHGDQLEFLSDWDISGKTKKTVKRLGYQKLLEAIEAGDCQTVYSYSLSRLGRSVPELSRFFELCHDRKIPIRLVVDSVDTSTASGRLIANILASVSAFEAEVAGERLLAMYETKRIKARANGEDPRDAVRTSKRYGEAEGQDVDLVLRLFRETGSFTRTARRLNEMGIPARQGKAWWSSSVAVVVERLDPTVATREKRAKSKAGGTGFILAKLLRCPTCGAMLTGGRIPDKTGKRWTRYACRHAEATPHQRVSIAEHLILPAVEEEAAHYRNEEEERGFDVPARRAELLARRERIVEMRLDGLLSREDAVSQAAEVDVALNALVPPARPDMRLPRQRSPQEQNAILRQLFERVELDPETFQPTYFVWRHPEWRDPLLKADDMEVEFVR